MWTANECGVILSLKTKPTFFNFFILCRPTKNWIVMGPEHPSAIYFFRVHTIPHDIQGIDTIITRYLRLTNMENKIVFLSLFLTTKIISVLQELHNSANSQSFSSKYFAEDVVFRKDYISHPPTHCKMQFQNSNYIFLF